MLYTPTKERLTTYFIYCLYYGCTVKFNQFLARALRVSAAPNAERPPSPKPIEHAPPLQASPPQTPTSDPFGLHKVSWPSSQVRKHRCSPQRVLSAFSPSNWTVTGVRCPLRWVGSRAKAIHAKKR